MRFTSSAPIGASICLLTVLFGCEHNQTVAPEGRQATLSNIQATVLSQKCGVSGCHVPGGRGPMPLRSAQESFQNLVGVPSVQRPELDRVTPNDPDNSYVVQKLDGAPGIIGDRMPFATAALPPEQIRLIRLWIANGARND